MEDTTLSFIIEAALLFLYGISVYAVSAIILAECRDYFADDERKIMRVTFWISFFIAFFAALAILSV